MLGSDSTKVFCISVDETVLKAAKRILDFAEVLARSAKRSFVHPSGPRREQRRHAARIGGMIAAEAPTKEQNDSDLRTLRT